MKLLNAYIFEFLISGIPIRSKIYQNAGTENETATCMILVAEWLLMLVSD